jgi:hypothetical protein
MHTTIKKRANCDHKLHMHLDTHQATLREIDFQTRCHLNLAFKVYMFWIVALPTHTILRNAKVIFLEEYVTYILRKHFVFHYLTC